MQGGGGGSVSWGPNSEPGALSGIQMVAPVKHSSSPRITSLTGNYTCGPLSWVLTQLWVGTVLAEDDIDVHPQELG